MTALTAAAPDSAAIQIDLNKAAVLGFAAAALWMQLSAFPNHDVAWVLWGAREMMGDGVWGRDIIEPNPPLAWYLSIPAVLLSRLSGLALPAANHILVTAAALGSLFSFDALLRRADAGEDTCIRMPLHIAAIFLLLLPGRDFGQREHLTLIAALPYFALVALRCRERSIAAGPAIAVGFAAGLGFALKPYLLAVPVAVQLTALVLTRRWATVLRPELFAIGFVVAVYATWLLAVDRTYIDEVVPLAQEIYWSFNKPLADVVGNLLVPIVAVGVGALLARGSQDALTPIAAAAAVGFALACIAQQKGYGYHQFPVAAVAALAMAAITVDRGLKPADRAIAMMVLATLLAQSSANTVKWWQLNGLEDQRSLETQKIVDAVDEYARGGSFLAVSVHPFPGFPTALYAQSAWASRTNSQWFLPTVAQLRDMRQTGDTATLAFAETQARAFILHDLSQTPRLVLIDTDSRRHTESRKDIDFLSFYEEDPRFRALWSSYREINRIGAYRVFVRKETRDER